MLRAMAAARGAAMARREFGSVTATLDISTSMAGPVTERRSRTSAPDETAGEPGKCCARSACTISARRWLDSASGRCACSQEIKGCSGAASGLEAGLLAGGTFFPAAFGAFGSVPGAFGGIVKGFQN